MRKDVLCLFAALLFAVKSTLAYAQADADGPKEPLLTIEVVEATEVTTYLFSLEDLDVLPQESFDTSTIWTEGIVTFSGPPLKAVLESVGAPAKSVRAFALNDYNMVIAPSRRSDSYPVVATRMNGERFSVRERGPLWLVYPYDSHPDFRDERIYAQSIWQLYKFELD